MKKSVVYKSCARMLAAVLLFATASVQADIEELAVTISSLDLAANNVTLQDLDLAATKFRLAFDVEIKLLSGENGTAGNLREGDSVTAIVDRSAGVVYKLFVLGR